MKKKRIMALTLATIMGISSVVAGCGKTEDTGAEGKNTTKDVDKSAEDSSTQESDELTVWVWDPAFSIYSMKEAEKIYQKEHPEFKLKIVETQSVDVETKIMTMAEAGNLKDLPDIFCLQDSSFQKMYENYPEVFTDLTDSGIDYSAFIDAKVAVSEIDGKNYGIPFDTGTSIYAVRADYLEEAGHTTDELMDITWDEFIEIGKDVLEATGNPMLISMVGEPDLIFQMMQSAGQSIFQEDGSAKIADNELLLECINIYNEMKELGILKEVNSWDEQIAALNRGTATGVVTGCWILASIQIAEDQKGKWAVTNIPSLPGVEGATNYSNQGGSTWVISSNCKNKEAAADFFASTYGGNVEFFKTVFPSTGLVSPVIAVGESGIYDEELEFFGGQKVFRDIAEYAKKVPAVPYGKYFAEARTALAVAMTTEGSEDHMEEQLQLAQEELDFLMNNSQ